MAVLAAALAVLACGCSSSSHQVATEPSPQPVAGSTKPPPDDRPPFCRLAVGRESQRQISGQGAVELSGLVASRKRAGLFWAHNDSGDSARLLALSGDGRTFGWTAVTAAEAVDWEDIAAAGGDLYIGDIGDNRRRRQTITVYRLPEPLAGAAASAPAAALKLTYPDGAQNAEALIVDPRTRTLVIVTKDFRGRGRVYEARSPSARATTTLRFVGELAAGIRGVTAADIDRSGETIVLRTYTELFVWRRRVGRSVAGTLTGRPCRWQPAFIDEGQGEAIAFDSADRALSTVNEARRPRLRRYSTLR